MDALNRRDETYSLGLEVEKVREDEQMAWSHVGVDGHGDIWKNIEISSQKTLIETDTDQKAQLGTRIWQKPAKSGSEDSKVEKLASYSKFEPTRCLFKDY